MCHTGDAWCDKLDKERFNAGILSLQPGMPDFVEMIADYRNDTLYKWEGQAEQGLLNWWVPNQPLRSARNIVISSADPQCHTRFEVGRRRNSQVSYLVA